MTKQEKKAMANLFNSIVLFFEVTIEGLQKEVNTIKRIIKVLEE